MEIASQEEPTPKRSRPTRLDSVPTREERIAARRRARPPAIGLFVVAGIDILISLAAVIFNLGMAGVKSTGDTAAGIGLCALWFVTGLVVLIGGMNLYVLNSYSVTRTCAIAAMIPCVSICPPIISLPIGVWALVTSASPDVRSAFRERKG